MPERWKVISQLGNLPAYIKSIGTRLKKHGDLERFRTLPRKWDKKHFGKKAFAPLAQVVANRYVPHDILWHEDVAYSLGDQEV